MPPRIPFSLDIILKVLKLLYLNKIKIKGEKL